ncbi:hypothetical protein B9J07_06560 [Sinorhizobium sp. LM21]|nr:hypothetical protein B9J07_06560 [Sinorhizobium sp. LM21]
MLKAGQHPKSKPSCLGTSGQTLSANRLRWWLAAGGIAYVVGVLLVTIVFNVPMNDALAAAAPGQAATDLWRERYLTDWVWWNHVRTWASIGALAFFVLGFART